MDEQNNQEPVVSDQAGLTITPEGDGGQTPIAEPEPQPEVQPEPEVQLEPGEHEDPMPQVDDPNALRAWVGRRDKKLREDYDQKLNQLVGLIQPLVQQQMQPQTAYQPAPAAPSYQDIKPEDLDFINDPQGSFHKLAERFATDFVPRYNQQFAQQQQQKATQVMTGIEFLAKNDPVIKDDATRILEIAKSIPVPQNFDQMDATTASRYIFTQAQNVALREKVQKKFNPLAGNKPVNKPIGTVAPSANSTPSKPKVSLSAELAAAAAQMGLTTEKAMELLKE